MENLERVVLENVVEIFLEEFPFLGRYMEASLFTKRPKVQRIDQHLLSRSPRTMALADLRDGWLGHRDYSLRFFLIGSDGQELGEVKQQHTAKTKFSFSQPNTWLGALLNFKQVVRGEMVLDAIMRLENPDQTAYILEIESCFERGELERSVIVHKVPSGKRLSEMVCLPTEQRLSEIENQIRKTARREFDTEMAVINKVK